MTNTDADKVIDQFLRAIKLPSYGQSMKRVKQLLAKGLDARVRSADGFSPLHQSATEGHPGINRLLIEKGANVNAEDKNRNTPLHFAAKFDRVEACRILIDHGANVHAIDAFGESPLHAAAKYSLEIFRMMLAAGGDAGLKPEAPPAGYLTPFQMAVDRGWDSVAPDVVRHAILHCGQSPSQTTDDGRTLDELASNAPAVLAVLHSLRTDLAIREAIDGGDAVAARGPRLAPNL